MPLVMHLMMHLYELLHSYNTFNTYKFILSNQYKNRLQLFMKRLNAFFKLLYSGMKLFTNNSWDIINKY